MNSFRVGKRNEIQVPQVLDSYEVDWQSIDDLIDAGLLSQPVRGFPEQWTGEAVGIARKMYAEDRRITELRAAELAITTVYERHEYCPSWNAPLFPETDILIAAGKLKRDHAKKQRRRNRSAANRNGARASQPAAPGAARGQQAA